MICSFESFQWGTLMWPNENFNYKPFSVTLLQQYVEKSDKLLMSSKRLKTINKKFEMHVETIKTTNLTNMKKYNKDVIFHIFLFVVSPGN